jgi:hypothetical protein
MSAPLSEEELRLSPEPEGITTSLQAHSTAEPIPEQGTGASVPVAAAVATMRRPITHRTATGTRGPADFDAINGEALRVLPILVRRWLPQGHRMGREWVALNPRRDDEHLGSFRINLDTGRWADFATGDRGGDPISLLALLNDCSQLDAARDLGAMLGVQERKVHRG